MRTIVYIAVGRRYRHYTANNKNTQDQIFKTLKEVQHAFQRATRQITLLAFIDKF